MEGHSRNTGGQSSSGEIYYQGQRRRRRLKKLKSRRACASLPNLQAAIEAQNRLVGESELLFGDPDRAKRSRMKVSASPSLLGSPELQLRFLNPADIPEIKLLCGEWFPIEYPDSWYTDITQGERFYSVGAVYRRRIIGLIVAEIKDADKLPKEDSEILSPSFGRMNKAPPQIGYILSIGVVKDFRGNGIASFLLDNLVAHLTSTCAGNATDVRALYLHVLTTNSEAISFYENRGFRVHLFLPCYYAVNGKRKDGFTYVLYLNGGHPVWTMIGYVGYCFQTALRSVSPLLSPWALTKAAVRKLVSYRGWLPIWPRLWQIAQSGAATVFS